MKKIKCFLIDDEPPAIELLENYTGLLSDQIEVVGKSYSAVKAFELIRKVDVDLLFLDIQMPALNGIDFIKSLKNPPSVILTTAYREYAIEGYDLDIIDYLLKPIAFDRFLKAIDRYLNRNNKAAEQVHDGAQSDHIYFNINRVHHKVVFEDILYIESMKDYVRIYCKNEKLMVKGNLGSIMKKMPTNQFVRVHRSFAISIHCIESYNQSFVEVAATKIPIGVSYRDEFMRKLKR